uniref:ATP synthase complex subunit 8 n=2 Tax=Accipiter nisus TaxID=211598 RepID=A0A0F6N6I6_9AVES|nr:ATP synthase F0 subunit 8 [Accipiter nisus]BAE44358.1 F0-ATP synthase subunit 8 [Accipiter nisus nisosimilis]AID52335.1 ATP synthase F0 subunit 8 [Accipiter nisus]AIU39014.1 ATP synthase F0 subunit 8 [Accipiter nisus]QHI42442.1 ATP synthase F0 subunit 8 [Accipiter nisus]QNV48997.1 ATP synthase F0 subunit 8 [Accipiter nisus]
MPQLNPTPWFLTMLLSWLIFALLIQPKLLPFIPTNTPSNKLTQTTPTLSWNWPWT